MISMEVINELGESIFLDIRKPEDTGFLVASINGLGPPKGNINIIDSALSDGGVFNSSRLETRNILIYLIMYEDNNLGESVATLRNKTYKYFPVKKKVKLIFDDGEKKVYTEGRVESNETTPFTSRVSSQISIICPDPYFYNVSNTIDDFSGISPMFEYPFENPIEEEPESIYDEVNTNNVRDIYYEGSYETGFLTKITINHVVDKITMFNLNTRKQFSIDISVIETIIGREIKPMDEIHISSELSNKYIKLVAEGVEYNVLSSRVDGSQWITIVPGDNVIAFTTYGTYLDINLTIERKTLYGGL